MSRSLDTSFSVKPAQQFCVQRRNNESTTIQFVDCNGQVVMLTISCFLLVYIHVMFFRFLIHQKCKMRKPIYRIQIVSLRICTIIPLFATTSILAFMLPSYFVVFECLYAFAEGVCVYCFFKSFVYALGTNEEIIELIQSSEDMGFLCFKIPIWRSCQLHRSCLAMLNAAFLQFMFLRPILLLSAGLIQLYYDHDNIEAVSLLPSLFKFFIVTALMSLVITLPAVVRTYELMGKKRPELSPLKKAFFVKLIILICVVQFNVINAVTTNYQSSEKDMLKRTISFAILVEVFLASLLSPYIFGFSTELLQRFDFGDDVDQFGPEDDYLSMPTYLCDVVCLHTFLLDANNTHHPFPQAHPYPSGLDLHTVEVTPHLSIDNGGSDKSTTGCDTP